ncbi:LptA/OstA family protein [Litorimonas sp. RW-G-Af-16]|uniref:LptA/OstA family protein n=1 Tax=Litorimonas sp. RW-G-Af-16 TaxID=3241168 RepID=UPI00390CA55D
MSAFAQFSANSGQDIAIDADDVINKGGVTTLTGQVDIRQGDVRMLADRVELYSKGQTGTAVASVASDIDRIKAVGNFYYITKEQEVRGRQGIYLADTDTFTVTGDVILLQGESVVTGETLIYNVGEQTARVTSNCQGRKCGTKNRVSILIKNSGNPGARS